MSKLIPNLIVNGLVALLMIILGIIMLKKDIPTGFYSGEKSPKLKNEKDVKVWNRAHALMFILYGALIILAAILMGLLNYSLASCIILLLTYMIPPFVMIVIHTKLEKKYVDFKRR